MTRTSKKLEVLSMNSRYGFLTRVCNSYIVKLESQDDLAHQKATTIFDRISAKTIIPVQDNLMAESIQDAININYSNANDIELCRAISTYMKNKEEVLV